MKVIKFSTLFFFVVTSLMGIGQNQKNKNLQDFDSRKFHLGFAIGYNSADFHIKLKQDHFVNDSLLSLDVNPNSGFNLSLVTSLNITPLMRLRFLPGLSFQDRTLNYTYFSLLDTTEFWVKNTNAVVADLPLLLKMRTERIGNLAAYMIVGGRFGIDMQSQKNVVNTNSNLKNQVIKYTKTDYGLEVGGGFDFFMEFFKLGIELKLSSGFKNVLIQENLKFSSPIDQIRTKIWTFSVTVEG